MIMSDTRSRHSPLAAQNPSILQLAEITNVQINLLPEQILQRITKDSDSDSDRAINEVFRLLPPELKGQLRRMLRQSIYLALNT